MSVINNIEAEQVVLGTLITDPKSAHFVATLNIDDFSVVQHRLIFEAIAAAAAEGRHASPVVLAPQFKGDKVGDINGAQYLGRLVTMATRRDCIPDHIRALKDMSGRRQLAEMAATMSTVARSHSAPLGPFLEHVAGTCDGIMAGLRKQQVTAFSLGDLNRMALERLRSTEESGLIRTGLRTLDEALGGYGRGELTIFGGRPGQGKTTLALSSMRQAAKFHGVSSIFFSQEMGGDPVSARMLSDAVFNSQTPIHYKKILRKTASAWEIGRLEDASRDMEDLPILIDLQSSLTVSDISVRARRHAERLAANGQRLDTIWIDHLGYMHASDRYRGNKVYETGEITKGLRKLARELGVAINLLCQLSRKVEEREDKRPHSHDVRDSGNIEEDADCMLLLYREAYYLADSKYDDPEKESKRLKKLEAMEHLMEVIATKTRNGGIFSKHFFTDIGSNAVRDLA